MREGSGLSPFLLGIGGLVVLGFSTEGVTGPGASVGSTGRTVVELVSFVAAVMRSRTERKLLGRSAGTLSQTMFQQVGERRGDRTPVFGERLDRLEQCEATGLGETVNVRSWPNGGARQ